VLLHCCSINHLHGFLSFFILLQDDDEEDEEDEEDEPRTVRKRYQLRSRERQSIQRYSPRHVST
jgi:hypothetical protein